MTMVKRFQTRETYLSVTRQTCDAWKCAEALIDIWTAQRQEQPENTTFECK